MSTSTEVSLGSVVESVVEEIEASVVETVKNWRELQIRSYWEAGRILRHASESTKIGITALVGSCSKDPRMLRVKMGARSLWFSLSLYEQFPDFEKVYETEHGQNISVAKLKQLISPSSPKEEPTLTEVADKLIHKWGVPKAREFAELVLSRCAQVETKS